MPNTAHGFYYPNDTTNLAPLHTVLANMQTSVNSYFNANVTVHPIANIAGRAALISEYPPTTTFPLVTWRADAPASQKLEVTTDGITWSAIGADPAALTYNAQTLTGPQKLQVRTNIGAFSPTIASFSGDVNTVLTQGWYQVSSSSTNTPRADECLMEVLESPTNVVQRLSYVANERTTWTRTYLISASTWSAWRCLDPTPVSLPSARLVRTTTGPSVSSSTWAQVTFSSATYDTSGLVNPGTGVATVPAGGDGKWRAELNFPWANYGSAFRRIVAIFKGSTATGASLAAVQSTAAGRFWAYVAAETNLVAGDTITCWVWSDTSSGGSTIETGAPPTTFNFKRVE
jgi:hypothetical protein